MLWMLVWAIAMTSAMAFAQMIKPAIGVFNVILARAAIGFIIVAIVASIKKVNILTLQAPKLAILSVFFAVLSVIMTYVAYTNLPLYIAVSIGFTGPIINMLLAVVILKESFSWRQLIAVSFCFVGVLIEIQPQAYGMNPYVFIALGANLFAGLAILTIKNIVRNDPPLSIWVFNGFAQTAFYLFILITIIIAGYGYIFNIADQPLSFNVFCSLEYTTLIQIALMGVLGVSSQYLRMRALKLAAISTLAPMEYSRIILAIPFDFIILGIMPTQLSILAAALIIGANFFAVWTKR